MACGSDTTSPGSSPAGGGGNHAGSGGTGATTSVAGADDDGAGSAGVAPLGGSDEGGSAGAREAGSAPEAGSAGEGGGAGTGEQTEMISEAELTVELTLTVKPAVDPNPASATLQITARDGTKPVITDLWLYTLQGNDKTPLTGFTSSAARKTGALMLPATIGGQPSGLAPADDGVQNGLMSNATRGTWLQGAFVSTVNGTATVTLPAVPTDPLLVVAGVEDQRYAGAAVVNADGTPGQVPAGSVQLERHIERSFARDVLPMLQQNCTILCHNVNGPEGAAMYKMDTRDLLVNDNFALTESTTDCQTKYPTGGTAFDACVQAITKAQFLVEPGAPAVSDLLQRARPDEESGSSATGLLWFGGGTPRARYNAKYGDRRMPSTTISLNAADWTNLPTFFDQHPDQFQVLYDWVAQGALP